MGERQKKSDNAFQKMGRYNDNKDGIVYTVWKKRLEKAVTDVTGQKGWDLVTGQTVLQGITTNLSRANVAKLVEALALSSVSTQQYRESWCNGNGKLNEHGVMLLKQCAKEVLQHVCEMLGEHGFQDGSEAKKQLVDVEQSYRKDKERKKVNML